MTLKEWMDENCYGTHTLSRLLAKRGVKVSPQSILKWLKGAVPHKEHREAIEAVTNGKVLPSNFV